MTILFFFLAGALGAWLSWWGAWPLLPKEAHHHDADLREYPTALLALDLFLHLLGVVVFLGAFVWSWNV